MVIQKIRRLFASLTFCAVTVALLVALTGCGAEPPYNPQPVIEVLPVSDITRTEAVVTVSVQQRGTTPLTRLSLYYSDGDNGEHHVSADNPTATSFTVRLTDLKPGTAYSCYAEGGTATASIRSATVTFTTEPNDRPDLSELKLLSTGPVGVIVSFDIVSDGGEPVQQAGCEVTDVATGNSSRFYLGTADLVTGTHKLNVTGLTQHTAYALRPFASNTVGETLGTAVEHTTSDAIVLCEAGELATVLDGNLSAITELKIVGPLDGDDFAFMRMLLGAPLLQWQTAVSYSITAVDLSNARITEGGVSYDGYRYTVPDEISTGLFANCTRLQDIRLPVTATVLARDAFAGCTDLRRLTVPPAVTRLLPSEGCTALAEIEVSAASEYYASVGGVLYNHAVTEILWFPLGKTGAYTLPPTLLAIGEGAFAGTSLTALVIPPSVKSIGRGAFADSALSDITLPDNLANVPEAMFQGSAHLATVRLGSGTVYVGDYAFDGTVLTSLYIAAQTPPFAANNAFMNGGTPIFQTCTLYVPAGCKNYYRNHAKWGQFNKIAEY